MRNTKRAKTTKYTKDERSQAYIALQLVANTIGLELRDYLNSPTDKRVLALAESAFFAVPGSMSDGYPLTFTAQFAEASTWIADGWNPGDSMPAQREVNANDHEDPPREVADAIADDSDTADEEDEEDEEDETEDDCGDDDEEDESELW